MPTDSRPHSPYLFHGTTADTLDGIVAKGLRAREENEPSSYRKYTRRAIFVTEDYKQAKERWAKGRMDAILEETGVEQPPVVFRFRTSSAPRTCSFTPDMVIQGEERVRVPHSWLLEGCTIPTDVLEVKQDGKWVPVTEVEAEMFY